MRDLNSLVTVHQTTLVSKYTALEKIYNDLAPLKSRWITHRPHPLWYDNDLSLVKCIKWRADRSYVQGIWSGSSQTKNLQWHVTNTKSNWSCMNRPDQHRWEGTRFFEWSTNCFNLAAQPFLLVHLLRYCLKILTNSSSGKSNPSETNSRIQLTIQCNLNIRLKLTNLL